MRLIAARRRSMRLMPWALSGLVVATSLSLLLLTLSSLHATTLVSSPFADTDWPNWRGADHNGIANDLAQPPTTWSSTSNVAWSTTIPGTGHGSPIVVGERVVVATADLETQEQSLVCLNRESGKLEWKCVVHAEGVVQEGNSKTSLASSTPAFDGEQFYINFLNGGAVHASAVSLEGEVVWQRKISDYVVHQGFGASPFIYQDLVLIAVDHKGEAGGVIAGLSRETGEIQWSFSRPAKPNYVSPIVFHLEGRDQLILVGCDEVVSLAPANGEVLWRMEGSTTEVVTTTVTDGTHVYTSGGYPKNHVSAVVADGSGKVAWENDTRVYVPSMIVKEGYLYAIADAGIAYCWNAATGEEMWKERLGGTFSSSPVIAGDRMFATNEGGETFVLQISPERVEQLAKNQLGESVFATPAISGDSLFVRVTETVEDQRSDVIYRLKEM